MTETSSQASSHGGRSPRVSLKLRITLWVVLIFTLIQAATLAVFVLHQRATAHNMFERQLEDSARACAESIAQLLPNVTRSDLTRVAAEQLRFSQFEATAIDVFNDRGESVVPGYDSGLSLSALGLASAPTPGTVATVNIAADQAENGRGVPSSLRRAIATGVTGAGGANFVVVVASSQNALNAQLSLIMQLALISGVVALVAAAVAARIIAGMAVAPLERLRSVAQGLGPESIGEKVKLDPVNTEVARLSEELDKAMSRIQDGFVAKERFLTNVSHEIKTPIAVLLIEAQTVNREDCSADVRRFMDTVEEEMTRLGKLVESFLTLTRLQSGRGPATLKRYCVNDLVTDAISSCNTMARQHQVSLQPVLLADEETVDAAVVGDPDLLRTLVENLIRNSIRFSSAGEPVEVIGEVTGDQVHVRVRDTGPGIPPDRLGTIFDRFAQAHNTERQGRGHGLGLAIAKGIAELHGGTVEAHNRPERGCEFIVRLRLAAVPKLQPSAT